MAKKKYRLKKGLKGQVSLTTPSFACTIKEDIEYELTDVEIRRMKDFIEVVPKKVKKVEPENVRAKDNIVEDTQ